MAFYHWLFPHRNGVERGDPPGWPMGRWGPPGYTQAQACLCHLPSRQQIPGAGPRVGPRGPHGTSHNETSYPNNIKHSYPNISNTYPIIYMYIIIYIISPFTGFFFITIIAPFLITLLAIEEHAVRSEVAFSRVLLLHGRANVWTPSSRFDHLLKIPPKGKKNPQNHQPTGVSNEHFWFWDASKLSTPWTKG